MADFSILPSCETALLIHRYRRCRAHVSEGAPVWGSHLDTDPTSNSPEFAGQLHRPAPCGAARAWVWDAVEADAKWDLETRADDKAKVSLVSQKSGANFCILRVVGAALSKLLRMGCAQHQPSGWVGRVANMVTPNTGSLMLAYI